jgi:hypothetical protein
MKPATTSRGVRAVGLTVGVFLAQGACRAPEDAFTERVAVRARALQPGATVVVKERLHLEVTVKDGTRQMFLDNLWRFCQANADACDESMARSVAVVAQEQATSDTFVKAEFVRPILKDREWMENVRQMMKDGPPEKAAGNAVVSRPFVADMFVVYAFDLPDGMRMLNRSNLAELKLDDEQLHGLALANLEKATPAMTAEAVEPGSRIRVMHVGDSYDASRVILHGRWKAIAAGVEGDLVVAAPSRDYVYFTGSREDLAGLRALARSAAAESDHALSATLLRWKPEGWEAFP